MDNFSISIVAKAKHGMIYQYMSRENITADALAAKIGISAGTLGKIINFKWLPTDHCNKIETLNKVCNFFKCKPADIFPPELIRQLENNQEILDILQNKQIKTQEIDLVYLADYTGTEQVYLPEYDNIDLQEKLSQTLETLTEREQIVLKHRFGLDGRDELSLESVAKLLNVTRERVRQIEAKALRKLRHPSRCDFLKDFVK